jgi:DNA repair protein RecO (recombination protein O)
MPTAAEGHKHRSEARRIGRLAPPCAGAPGCRRLRARRCRFPVEWRLRVPLFTADALVLRTYKLGEADRIVVFLTRDRGKKRGVAKGARRPRSRFAGALEPLTDVRVAYFESERRELVGLNYAETRRSPLLLTGHQGDALGHVAYFAELLDEWAQEADADERLYRLGASMLEALAADVPVDPLARYFEYWLLRLQGVYPEARGTLSAGALAFLASMRAVPPHRVGEVPVPGRVLDELQNAHRALIAMHLEKTVKSDRVLRDLRRHASTSREVKNPCE